MTRRLTWEDVERLAEQLATSIAERRVDLNTIVAVARGGLVPARLLSDLLGISQVTSIGIRYVDDRRSRREIYSFPEPLGASDCLLLVEDMLESGRTMRHARDALTERGAQVYTATLLHRADSVISPDFSAGLADTHLVLPWDLPLAARAVDAS